MKTFISYRVPAWGPLIRVSLLSASLITMLAGCNSTLFAKQAAPAADESQQRLRWLEKDLRRKETALQEMRERNLVLERKMQGRSRPAQISDDAPVPVPFDPSAAGIASEALSAPVNGPMGATRSSSTLAKTLPPRVSRVDYQKEAPEPASDAAELEQTGEQRLYSKVLETYRKHNLAELQKSLQFLLKTYPESVYADNALYMAGLLAMELGDPARSHYYMNRVVREYPRGNKTVSALFAIAMIEKRKNKLPQAQNILKSLEHLYPGSPEAARAATELKFIKKQAARSREG